MGNEDSKRVVAKATVVESRWLFTRVLEGMVIGAINGVHITHDTPLDPDQWKDGKAWHWK